MKPSIKGFTLVEMAVVLVVIGLLMTGLLGTARNQIESKRLQETQTAMAEIREALIAFTIRNGRLPCPADRVLATTNANAGLEAVNGNACAATVDSRASANDLSGGYDGVIPWRTLGVRELDAWGTRYTYRVTDVVAVGVGVPQQQWFARSLAIADPLPCTGQTQRIAIGICSTGNITTKNNASLGGNLSGQDIAAMIISHGKNKRGGYGSDGVQVAGAAGDELLNADRNNQFVNSPNVDDPANPGTALYDDLTEWISANILIGKLINAGRLP